MARLSARKRAAFGLDGGETPLHAVHPQVHGLLAEDRLAGPHEPLDQVGVGVGRRADQYRGDVAGSFDLVNRADFTAVRVHHPLRSLGHRIGNGDELCPRNGVHGPGMDLADAACAQHSQSDCHVPGPLRSDSGYAPATYWSKSTTDPVITPESSPSMCDASPAT